MRSQKNLHESHASQRSAGSAWSGRIILTLVDVQHEAIEVDSLFTSVFHMGVKQVHEHGLSCA